MLVMKFLTNKQVFKAPSWYLTQIFGKKSFKKTWQNVEKGGKNNFSHFFIFFFTLNKHKLCPYAKFHSDSQKNKSMNPENLKILTKWENITKQGENRGEKGSQKL